MRVRWLPQPVCGARFGGELRVAPHVSPRFWATAASGPGSAAGSAWTGGSVAVTSPALRPAAPGEVPDAAVRSLAPAPARSVLPGLPGAAS